ncbi:MAG: efflux RND transporter periplasmic adaptor subunit [Gammaproteobacteria bacterium]
MNAMPVATVRLFLAAALLALAAGCGDTGSTASRASEPEHEHEGDDGHDEDDHEGDHEEHEGEEAAGAVRLTPEQIRSASITVTAAGPATIREQLPLYGVIAPNAERVREITPRFPGVIRSVSKRLGDSVRQGEALATVESNESLQTYALAAPLSGVVTARNANPGEQTGERVLFTVADLSTVWVEVALFPRDRSRVQSGQSARVTSSETGKAADGRIVYVAPFGSASNQTLTARVLIDNADGHWAPGLYVTVDVTLAESEVPVAVRSEALQILDGRTVVFGEGPQGFQPLPVETGRSDGESTEILGGLEPGDRYVAGNSFILKAELGKGEASHEH